MRSSCLNKYPNILNLFDRNISVDSGKMFGAILTALSKAFVCLSHELLIAKLNAYGLSVPALRLVKNIYQIASKGPK